MRGVKLGISTCIMTMFGKSPWQLRMFADGLEDGRSVADLAARNQEKRMWLEVGVVARTFPPRWRTPFRSLTTSVSRSLVLRHALFTALCRLTKTHERIVYVNKRAITVAVDMQAVCQGCWCDAVEIEGGKIALSGCASRRSGLPKFKYSSS
ncbi:hypothetical protein BU25DRAFT_184798 [Macroventuria anomochaeta]|uniref:Uncharacterized protein n=1 Tax=Macroventuria anomochaeta TaxID=301207 RepID=A0ACB6SAN2_9PLEO|nr:uncharacterized protein BU25DRAFT_184798 [Macroventuria anomochaeta]KAF2631350.1 hypothetical protein BU25DRAFT_184798 [Macroventuria anomochaeta]